MKTRTETQASHANRASLQPVIGLRPQLADTRTILLISGEKRLHKELVTLANTTGQMVIRAAGTTGTMVIFQAANPAAVLLDLDLPNEAAWTTAEQLMQEPNCPPVILLTAQTDWFEPGTAIRAGCLVSKTDSLANLMDIVEQAVGLPESNRAEWNAIQRVLLRWLKPSPWPTTPITAYRFWGINE
jgi:FixJ family two-component response regulator